MTPVVRADFANVLANAGRCEKPTCTRLPAYRHHKGDQHKWIVIFAQRMQTVKGAKRRMMKQFIIRYHAFYAKDICYVCGDHHEEVHELLYGSMIAFVTAREIAIPREDWPFELALDLVQWQTDATEEWLQHATPGLKRRILTSYR